MIRHRREDLELWLQVLAQVHNGRNVSAAVAVVGRRPDSDDILVFEMVLVALIDQLMSTGDKLQAIDVIELGCGQSIDQNGKHGQNRTSEETLSPNSHPAPRGDTAQVSTSSGSLQTRSQNAPSCGISCARATTRIWSNVRISGLRPPWTQRTFPSTIAASARKSKT